MRLEDHIQALILDRYDNPFRDQLCSCTSGLKRLVKCHASGCSQYPVSCARCFVRDHYHNPLHWALVWDELGGFWVKCEYSAVIPGGFIQLGHVGERQSCPLAGSPVEFIITHTNGVHNTNVKFCECSGAPDRLDQLLLADMFPGTPTEPRSAFTIALLKEFHMHNFQSKCGAFDYIMSIRRLTDNKSTAKVSVSFY